MFSYQHISSDSYNQPHMFGLNGSDYDTFRQARAWARQHFGRAVIGERWAYGGSSFWLRDEQDAIEFRLRWC